MKKSLLVIAVAATMAAPAAMAAPTVYGNIHLSINAASADNNVGGPGANAGARDDLQMSSNTSAIGVKGSEDLGDGMKAIYKMEFGVDITGKANSTPDSSAPNGAAGGTKNGTLSGRDQFVGIKGGYGTIKLGTMSSNYKQMGGKIDPLYRTPLEGRGFLNTQSKRHSGKGINRGRQTNTVMYVSPKMAGINLVANTTVSGAADETLGAGLRWSNKSFMAYVDYITGQSAVSDSQGGKCTVANSAGDCSVSHSTKVGGKFHNKTFALAAQYEAAQSDTGADYIFASALYNVNKNNSVALTGGQTNRAGSSNDTSTGVALAYNHKLSKMTNVYAGYGLKTDDRSQSDESMFTVGIKKKF